MQQVLTPRGTGIADTPSPTTGPFESCGALWKPYTISQIQEALVLTWYLCLRLRGQHPYQQTRAVPPPATPGLFAVVTQCWLPENRSCHLACRAPLVHRLVCQRIVLMLVIRGGGGMVGDVHTQTEKA